MAITGEVQQALSCYERAFGVLVTVHDYDGRLRGHVGSERLVHRHPRCVAAKGLAERKCLAADTQRIRNELPFAAGAMLRSCHADVTEAICACRRDGRLAWILFAGPISEAQQAEDVLEGLRQLAARLQLWEDQHPAWPRAARVEQGGSGDLPDRAGHIQRWMQLHHREDLGLDELAAELGLSRYQASRVVKSETGRGFSALLLETRLTTACALLQETDLDIMDVAVRSGFGDRSHFHRVFKRAMGMSPLAWRRADAVEP